MWSIVSLACVVVAGLLGFLTTMFPELVLPPHRWWTMGVFVAATVFGAISLYANERQDSKDRELYERLALGRGGYPTVLVLGMMPIPSQISNGRVLAQILVLNQTDIPVFDCRIKFSHRVGVPNGFRGTDTQFYDFDVFSVNPHSMPHALHQGFLLKQNEPNIFSALVFTRWAKFTQRIAVVWRDGAWHAGTEVTQLADEKQGTENKVVKAMEADLLALVSAPSSATSAQ